MVIYLDPMVQVPGRGRHSAGRHQVKFCKKRRIKLPILILIRDPQKWESCGTSRVAWLRGRHPELAQGTVSRTVSCHCSYSFLSLCLSLGDIPRTFLCLWSYLYFVPQICVGEISGDCGHEASTRVRTCPDSRGGTFWVSRLYRIWRSW